MVNGRVHACLVRTYLTCALCKKESLHRVESMVVIFSGHHQPDTLLKDKISYENIQAAYILFANTDKNWPYRAVKNE